MANSWRRERWDSLRLLTPNWQTRLPGHRYEGADPDGFMTMAEVVDFVSASPTASAAPVRTQTTVTSVTPDRRRLPTSRPTRRPSLPHAWCSRAAPATCPTCRRCAQAVPPRSQCFTPLDYRNPDQLPEGGVLVVGASATGVQLADEIHRSGRPRDALGRRARPAAADLSRPRRAVVDGRVGRVEPALRRDRRPDARATAAVAATGRHAGAHDARPQRPQRGRRRARRPAGRRARRRGALFRADCATSSRWPISR